MAATSLDPPPVAGSAPAARKSTRKAARPTNRRRRETGVALLFVLPALLGFAVFYAWPILNGLYYSFTDYSLLAPPEWIGLKNYTRLFDDAEFWSSLARTLEYVVINIGVQTTLALILAVLLHRLTRSVVIRGVMLLPYLVSNVVVALLWYWMADYNLGIVNHLLGQVGIAPLGFFGDAKLAIPTIALVNAWRHMGYTALLIFAGLQTIPRELYEAAAVDGASEWRVFRRITLPLLRPVLALVLVLNVIGSWQIFDTIAVIDKGGPANATKVIQYYIYDKAFSQYDFGYAAALAVALFVLLLAVSLVQLKLTRADQSDQA